MAQIWVVSDVRNKLCLALIWKRFWTAYPGQFSELLDNPWRLDFIRFDLIWFCLGKFWYRKHIEKCYGDERPSWARKPVEVNPGEDKEVGFTFYRVLVVLLLTSIPFTQSGFALIYKVTLNSNLHYIKTGKAKVLAIVILFILNYKRVPLRIGHVTKRKVT